MEGICFPPFMGAYASTMNVILEKEWHGTLFCLQGLGQIVDAPWLSVLCM